MTLTPQKILIEEQKYEKIAQNTKRHHWVPQFYLRYFVANNEKDQVYMYQHGNKSVIVNVAGIATKKELYTFEKHDGGGKTRMMEGVFSEHEGMVATVMNKILENEELPEDENDRSHIAAFVSMLRVRGPSFTDWLKNMEIEHIKLLQQIKAEHPDSLKKEFKEAGITFSTEEEFEEMRNFMRDPSRFTIEMTGGKGHYFKQAMELGEDFYNILMLDKSWHLLVAPQKRHFITSDNPVVIQELHDCPPQLAGGFLNGTILLTISPKYCLAFRRIPLQYSKIVLNREDVNHINKSIANAARKQLYSHLDSKDITILCNEYLSGDESRVSIKRLANLAPYFMSSGIHQFKESETLKNNSVAFKH